ncbi:hypothetical protein [Flectobacillus major]|uniref:hypothetical protein n=1 Tax=Flectobacillus major TaxID=103 RepID=UPI0004123D55|nr:hypothetical protein [Flectobacillus major]
MERLFKIYKNVFVLIFGVSYGILAQNTVDGNLRASTTNTREIKTMTISSTGQVTINNNRSVKQSQANCLVITEGEAAGLGNAEKRKTILKTYQVDAKDQLQIHNQHGMVNVELWNKNEFKIEISITGYGNTEEKAQSYVDGVNIAEMRVGDKIVLRTEIGSESSNNKWWSNWSWKSKDGSESVERQGVEVNYQVFMPKNNALAVSNKYGNTHVAEFSAPLTINTNYGNFTSERLTGTEKDINVQYGKATIRQLDEADLRIAYSKLIIDKANLLKLKNNFGSLNLDQVNTLDGNIQYSSGKIGTIRDNGKIYISFSDGLELIDLPRSLKTLDIKCNYTSVKLPVTSECNADFDVTVNYANFKYPSGKFSFTVNPDDSNETNRMGWMPTKTYKGKIGKGSGTKIVIHSNYGGVKFLEK